MEVNEKRLRDANRVHQLSERQRQCIALAGRGLTSKQIARELGLSPSTVDNHIRSVMEKMQAANRLEAARMVEAELGSQSDSASDVRSFTRDSIEPLGLSLPPLGGAINNLSPLRRLFHIAQIALIGTMVFAALTATIAGLVALFAR